MSTDYEVIFEINIFLVSCKTASIDKKCLL